MYWALAIILAAGLCLLLLRARRTRDKNSLDRHSITAEQLHSLMAAGKQVLLFDVRQPLDLLAYPEVIPGAQRIPPEEVIEKPSLIPKDQDTVIYCTCPSDKTSRRVLRRALNLGFSSVRFLQGGLAAWKAMGYPVEPYREPFRLHASG
jgi:rhodanese-related sulfurtransferase